MHSRMDLPAYRNAARTIENCRLLPQGGVTRRPGSTVLAEVNFTNCQIEDFIFSSEQAYSFFLSPGELHIWNKVSRTFVQTISGCPWQLNHLALNEVQCTQNLDTMFIAHHDFETQVIKRTSATTFTRNPIVYATGADNAPLMPFHKFVRPQVNMSLSATTGSVTVTVSDPVFVAEHVGTFFRYKNTVMLCTAITSSTEATMTVYGTATGTAMDPQWDEQAFSAVRGWCGCTTFHEQRFVMASGHEVPNAIWLSTTIGPLNFDLGTGEPADAIKAIIYADRVVEIKALASQNNLQIFASHGEFIVPWGGQNALTPANFSIKQQSGYGIRGVKAVIFDTATIFITRVANAIREFSMSQVGYIESYAADSVTYMAKDLIRDPVSIDSQMEGIGSQEALAYVTNSDGTLAILTRVKKENIGGWSLWTTQGEWKRLGVVDREAWGLVERYVAGSSRFFVEIIDSDHNLDFSLYWTGLPSKTIGPFPLHIGATVHVVDGDLYYGEFTVSPSGYITLPIEVTSVEIGFNYIPRVVPLRQEVQLKDGISFGMPKRYVRTVAQLEDTISITVGGRTLNTSTPNSDPSTAPPRKTGQFQVYHLGWSYQPEVVIESRLPLPFTLRALSLEVEI